MANNRAVSTKKLEDDLGMQILVDYKMMPVKDIRQNQQYQRMRDAARERKISKSIKRYGYWPQEVVILNELHEAIDGNHRVHSARENGIDEVPVSIVTFPNKQLEAKFFALKNSFNTQLKPIDFWHARHLSGHPYAELLYKLESDEKSMFYRNMAIKGHATKDSKFTIPKVLIIINTAAFSYAHPWQANRDQFLTDKVKELGYSQILKDTNTFLSFFFRCFGDSMTQNPTPFRTDSLRSFCVLYAKLKQEGHLSSPGKVTAVVNKMKGFIFTVDFIKTDAVGKVVSFINHYNKGRKNRLSYDVEIDV